MSTLPMQGAIIVVLVGPGERELGRLNDLLASVVHFEAPFVARSTLLLVNDRNDQLDGPAIAVRTQFREVVVLNNPYVGAKGGDLVFDRMTAGIWMALHTAMDRTDAEFVLKLDTDAMACGPFAERITRYFRDHPDAGMIGSLTHDPDGAVRNTEEWWGRWIRGTCGLLPHRWLRLRWHSQNRDRLTLEWRRWRRRHDLYRRAVRSAWVCGASVIGGAYALAPALVRRLREDRSRVEDVFLFSGTRMSEDVAVSMLTVALDLQLQEYNRPGEVFAVWYQKPTLPAAEIVRLGYGLVHSIKDPDLAVEHSMRLELADVTGIPRQLRERTQSFRARL